MSYEVIERKLFSRFRSIPENRLWKRKINALNALRNEWHPKYQPAAEAAARDAAPEVRAMAAWMDDTLLKNE